MVAQSQQLTKQQCMLAKQRAVRGGFFTVHLHPEVHCMPCLQVYRDPSGQQQTASDWEEVPAGAEVLWQKCRFKGQFIASHMAKKEDRWLVVIRYAAEVVSLLVASVDIEDAYHKLERYVTCTCMP